MTRTNHKSKPTGYEYWKSRLHRWGEIPGKLTKLWTHRKERRANKKIAREAIREMEI